MDIVTHEEQTQDPTRTCAGCRAEDAQEALLRLAVMPEEPFLVPDATRRLGGRGVSVHPRLECIKAAAERGGFARALKKAVHIDPVALAGLASMQYTKRIEGLLQAANRSRNLVVGTDAVRDAMSSLKGISALVVAEDAAGRREDLESRAARLGSACVVFGTKSTLGRLFGRDELGVVAILDGAIAREVALAAARVAELGRLHD